MANPEFYCDICNAPMKLTKLISPKESGKPYRQRWFKCVVCDYEKKVYADGMRDDEINLYYAKQAVKKIYKEEEENRR